TPLWLVSIVECRLSPPGPQYRRASTFSLQSRTAMREKRWSHWRRRTSFREKREPRDWADSFGYSPGLMERMFADSSELRTRHVFSYYRRRAQPIRAPIKR